MGHNNKESVGEIRDPIERFMYKTLGALCPDAEVEHEPCRIEVEYIRDEIHDTVPDIGFSLKDEEIVVYMELTGARLKDGCDPKYKQGKILDNYEQRVNENSRSLILYLQHFLDSGTVHCSIGILRRLALGEITTDDARGLTRDLIVDVNTLNHFDVNKFDWDLFHKKVVNGSNRAYLSGMRG